MRSLSLGLLGLIVCTGQFLVRIVCGTSESQSLLKLVSDKKMYDEWLKTMTVSEEVILSRFDKLLGIIDLDKDGFLNEEELTRWIRFVSERSTLKEVSAEFRMLDKDRDGKLSSEEFVRHFISGDENASSEETTDLEKFYIDLFNDVDSDKDGYLNVEEYYYLTNYYNLSRELFTKINSFLVQNDRNGDGIIDIEEINQIKKENSEVATSPSGKLTVFGADMSDQSELSVKKIIFLLRSQEIQDSITDSYRQLVDVYTNKNDVTKYPAIPVDFVKSNHVIYIQSILTDYGDVFKFPHDIFVGVGNKEYELSSEECTELFGENEMNTERSDEENEFDHDEFETEDSHNDDVEISDDMIQRLISLMGNSGLGDINDGSGSMFDVFANKAEGGGEAGGAGDLAGMEEILKMLQSLVGSKMGEHGQIPEDHHENHEVHEGSSFGIKDEL